MGNQLINALFFLLGAILTLLFIMITTPPKNTIFEMNDTPNGTYYSAETFDNNEGDSLIFIKNKDTFRVDVLTNYKWEVKYLKD